MSKNKKSNKYIKILIVLLLISLQIAIIGSIVKQNLGDEYVFHSWLSTVHMLSWILVFGLMILIPLTYINSYFGIILIPIILFIMLIVVGFNYTKEVKSGQYIVVEVQALGEKLVFYYTDINKFIMKRSHEEILR
ncbi:hypothetical protein [Paraclostridium bifermentans]|jgi:hypothetical protein|uniref:hypothetical protein n=1 Tax=Paraclostridium bifermentans TaxID=1490 RepID=UPI0018985423|nr:hypothetical protein [Paraclostridium bifermentans]